MFQHQLLYKQQIMTYGKGRGIHPLLFYGDMLFQEEATP
jgi:hypothetical protein